MVNRTEEKGCQKSDKVIDGQSVCQDSDEQIQTDQLMQNSAEGGGQTATYLVKLQGLNEHITLDNLPAKFGLLCGGIGVKVLELERVDDQDEEPAWGITVL